jgi:hypothetical protein
MILEGYTFKINTVTRLKILTMPDQFVSFKTPRNSMTERTETVFLMPAYVYDDPNVGKDGKVVVLVEGVKNDRFLHTLTNRHNPLGYLRKDLKVEYKSERINSSTQQPPFHRKFFIITTLSEALVKGIDPIEVKIPTEEEMIEAAKITLKEREDQIVRFIRNFSATRGLDVKEDQLDLINPTYS